MNSIESVNAFEVDDRNGTNRGIESSITSNVSNPFKILASDLADQIFKKKIKRKGKLKEKYKAEEGGDALMMDAELVRNTTEENFNSNNNNGNGSIANLIRMNKQNYNNDPHNPDRVWNSIKDKQNFQEPIYSKTGVRSPDCTRIVCISDTHSKHRKVCLPPGDVLIHGGDFTNHGEPSSIKDLCRYFREHSGVFDKIICIAGNHDVTLHSEYYQKNWKRYHRFKGPFDCEALENSLKNSCIYLRDSEYTKNIHNNTSGEESLQFYGSPWSPFYYDWAFNLVRGGPSQKVWKNIPTSTDVLITHGPPLGRGDLTLNNMHVGCSDLLAEVQDRIIPRVHIFGHIHEGYGVTFDGRTLFVNASNLDITYQAKNYPIVIDIPHNNNNNNDNTKAAARVVLPDCKIRNSQDLSNWCKENDYNVLAALFVEKADKLKGFSFRNNLFAPTTHEELATQLNIELDIQHMLREVFSKLYAESFPQEIAE